MFNKTSVISSNLIEVKVYPDYIKKSVKKKKWHLNCNSLDHLSWSSLTLAGFFFFLKKQTNWQPRRLTSHRHPPRNPQMPGAFTAASWFTFQHLLREVLLISTMKMSCRWLWEDTVCPKQWGNQGQVGCKLFRA